MAAGFNDVEGWAQLIDATITSREVHLEQLQLFVTGALRHPALVQKDCAFRSPRPPPLPPSCCIAPPCAWCALPLLSPAPPLSHAPTPPLATRSSSPPGGPCAALLSHISRIRREGVLIIECVLQWRRALAAADPVGMTLVAAAEGATSAAAAAAFRPYAWRGEDYLAKMLHDVDFLAELGAAPRMLELPLETLHFNPLFAPTTLANAMRTPTLPAVAEHLMNTCVAFEANAAAAAAAATPASPFHTPSPPHLHTHT